MAKCLHSGQAARAGVDAALLASLGMGANEAILEAPSGWGEVFGGGRFDADAVGDTVAALANLT